MFGVHQLFFLAIVGLYMATKTYLLDRRSEAQHIFRKLVELWQELGGDHDARRLYLQLERCCRGLKADHIPRAVVMWKIPSLYCLN